MLCLKWATGLEVLRGSQLTRKFPWERWLCDCMTTEFKLSDIASSYLVNCTSWNAISKKREVSLKEMKWCMDPCLTGFYWETLVMFECESCCNITSCTCCHNWIWELCLFLEAIYWGGYVLVFIHSMPLKQPGLQLRICLIQTAQWKHVMLHFIF